MGQDFKREYGRINHRNVKALEKQWKVMAAATAAKVAVTAGLGAVGSIFGPVGASVGLAAGTLFGKTRIDPVVEMYEGLQAQKRSKKRKVYPGPFLKK